MDPELELEDFYGLQRVVVRVDLNTSLDEALRAAKKFARKIGREVAEHPGDLTETDRPAGRRVFYFRLK